MSEMLKGVLDGVVMEIISHGETYGYEILKRLQALGFADTAEGTVYALLMRLEKQKLVQIEKRPSEIGPPRKFYTLSPKGIEELRAFWSRWEFLAGSIQRLRDRAADAAGNHEGGEQA